MLATSFKKTPLRYEDDREDGRAGQLVPIAA